MQQVYHSNATTNINIRSQLQNSSETNSELSSKFLISKQTVSKWKNRNSVGDFSSKPLKTQPALTDTERALIISLRTSSWASLDEIRENLLEINPEISRSSVYRCLVKEKINRIPKEQRDKAKKFKEYDPGYLHIDVTYLPEFNGKPSYLFVAIDRCTRVMIYHIYHRRTAENTQDFMDRCIAFFPFYITHILTDNGLEFTNKLLKSKTGNSCEKLSKMDVKCIENNIEHRLTAPFTPKTNGMVERVNGTIKSNTIYRTRYKSLNEMKNDLYKFLSFYNINRIHGSIRRELDVKTPLNAIEEWYRIKPEIFKGYSKKIMGKFTSKNGIRRFYKRLIRN